MGIYTPLEQFLASVDETEVSLTFSKIESIIGTSLPPSAYNYKAWWSNDDPTHTQSMAWSNAWFKAEVNLARQSVLFSKVDGAPAKSIKPTPAAPRPRRAQYTLRRSLITGEKTLHVLGYVFQLLQQLQPQRDEDGQILKFYPQSAYDNKDNLPLLEDGDGPFCKFTIEAGNWPGVYLWLEGTSIIYIGETENLSNRFNTGYGQISPINCYIDEQSQNCEMNKVVLKYAEKGQFIDLYFLETQNHKEVELELLSRLESPYNKKDNWQRDYWR